VSHGRRLIGYRWSFTRGLRHFPVKDKERGQKRRAEAILMRVCCKYQGHDEIDRVVGVVRATQAIVVDGGRYRIG
jgi:hypothetical protein